MKFSVIIPTWNEGPHISHALKRFREISDSSSLEVILVDGWSADNTVAQATPWVDHIKLLERPNRGAQLHAGAKLATGDLLFFLHADAQPPNKWQEYLEKVWLTRRRGALAATVFSIDYGSKLPYRLVAAGQNLRTRLFQVAYGDQGFCTTPENYEKSGGFPEIPLMEDVEFSRRIRALGRLELLPAPIWPSARRLRKHGALWNSVRNRWISLCYRCGKDPDELWKRYYAQGSLGSGPRRR
ncbi:MAG: TIGR04283 family arsenosugar biosynthesis glycosyltransferase [Elusimicrobia bacterium]|nr:TIGR04283 family arsenosugar biosynthesis glycosyltransferase [Elusimicrobiota bacterium]